jgi:hypothetical protein
MNDQCPERRSEDEGVGPAALPEPGRARGSRTLLNFWLDAALLVAILVLLWVSLLLRMIFPRATAAAGWELWGLSFDEWHEVQFFALCACALLALEHLVLHWKWVCGVIASRLLHIKKRPDKGTQALYGVGAFIIILFFLLATLLAPSLTDTALRGSGCVPEVQTALQHPPPREDLVHDFPAGAKEGSAEGERAASAW